MTFPGTPLRALVELFVNGAWTDITTDVYERDVITITRGRANESAQVTPSTCSLTLRNVDGKYSPRNPNGPFFGSLGRNTPIRVGFIHEGVTFRRFAGEVSSWPPRWELSGQDVWVPIEAAGIMRRLGQGVAPLLSAPRRYIPTTAPVAYWPLDAGPLATSGRPVVGDADMRPLSPSSKFGGGELAFWLDQAVTIESNATIVGNVSMPVQNLRWAVDHLHRATAGGSGPSTIEIVGNRDITSAADRVSYSMTMTPDPFFDVEIFVFFTGDTTSSATSLGTFPAPTLFTDDMHHIRFQTEDVGADVEWSFIVDGTVIASGTRTLTSSQQGISQVRLSYNPGSGEEPMSFGHVAVWGDDGIPLVADAVDAAFGHTGEAAGTRIERLAVENDVPFQPKGNLADTARMGPQTVDRLLTLMADCSAADMGILHEPRDMLGLAYRTRASMYDQVV